MTILYDVTGHPLLAAPGNKFNALATPEEKIAQNELAEAFLGLVSPAYVGDDAEKLTFAVALQVLFQMDQGLTPHIMKSEVQNRPGVTTTFKERFIHPGAAELVARVTRTSHHLFSAPTFGA